MTQDKIYNAETGAFVGKRKIHINDDGMYVILEGRPFECTMNEETNRFEV